MKFLVIFFLCLTACLAADKAPICQEDKCLIEGNCRCSSTKSPISVADTPQLISLAIDESVVEDIFETYWIPLLEDLENPDGAPVRMTFFVPHDYTDYQLVNGLFLDGHEIGVHSITKVSNQSYWRTASEDTLIKEFQGQKQIITKYANIPAEEIRGVRTPQLQFNGNVSISAYIKSELQYDSSWPTLPSKPLYPYTLDFLTTQECIATAECPNEAFPAFWVLPLVDLNGKNQECNSLGSCDQDGTVDEIANWLINEIEKVRTGSKAPLTITINTYWFSRAENAFEGLRKALLSFKEKSDVFFVTQKRVLDWIKNPVPLADFTTDVPTPEVDCAPTTCPVKKGDDDRYFKICIEDCPEVYPWFGNPNGNAQ